MHRESLETRLDALSPPPSGPAPRALLAAVAVRRRLRTAAMLVPCTALLVAAAAIVNRGSLDGRPDPLAVTAAEAAAPPSIAALHAANRDREPEEFRLPDVTPGTGGKPLSVRSGRSFGG